MSTRTDISQSLSQGASETAERLARRPKPKALLLRDTPRVSFELFPPSTPEGQTGFFDTADQLDVLGGTFMSVTYGASGTSQARTLNALQTLTSRCTTPMAGHLTCVGAAKEAVMAVVEAYSTAGVGQVIALRGDPPRGRSTFQPHPRGFSSASELVSAISHRGGFDIGVAAYPEVHPEAHSGKDDLDNLKRKIDAGARYAITQFFFEADTFLRFRDRAVAAGIHAPIIPGILPVVNLKRTITMARTCGTHVPAWVASLFDGLDEAPRVRTLVSATIAAELCTRLRDQGVDRFHFYTLNRSELAWAVCRMLGLRAVERAQPCRSAAASHA
ncbi:MAG TPA: methylenetetrahydrofolate reductase [NAD(P)H] [Gammaproteobacteria bacterium]|jgi:methylenetetrahydrofolate reductase (NADPH)|nr:methylenetetrahydrofolate reductase [NAD(P)H] [Acidiferrobacteraceae bacterium]MDP6399651.1 methylenetetrahydrofolate reductase [NAD(P)H] [Arenicellales bacterium]HCX86528.1 methylenetetrahydrofolate reductase [NAD(P)H] [Gammaproteobacteria bacterium]MDP6551024.1 methylenetetrahydrofolate reductase [NAD(P)H] [Arenicellales bacterium]MDP6792277.1 methylenetetrahydrofolate reductase [NAD(P)H] [Arenicellales bacterium]|tara:strand:+ start:9196 stop:10185 length:990 start_codon:yes stop_codon:yes gene_type:complete